MKTKQSQTEQIKLRPLPSLDDEDGVWARGHGGSRSDDLFYGDEEPDPYAIAKTDDEYYRNLEEKHRRAAEKNIGSAVTRAGFRVIRGGLDR